MKGGFAVSALEFPPEILRDPELFNIKSRDNKWHLINLKIV